jgi:hypothetical protein
MTLLETKAKLHTYALTLLDCSGQDTDGQFTTREARLRISEHHYLSIVEYAAQDDNQKYGVSLFSPPNLAGYPAYHLEAETGPRIIKLGQRFIGYDNLPTNNLDYPAEAFGFVLINQVLTYLNDDWPALTLNAQQVHDLILSPTKKAYLPR